MQLTKIVFVSIFALAQSITAALSPTGSVTSADKYNYAANYKITFKASELEKPGTLSIEGKVNNQDENVDLFIANKSDKSSDNLTTKKDIKFEDKQVEALFSYKGGDEDVTFTIKGYSDPHKNVAGTSVDFRGFYQPDGEEAVVETPFQVSAIFD